MDNEVQQPGETNPTPQPPVPEPELFPEAVVPAQNKHKKLFTILIGIVVFFIFALGILYISYLNSNFAKTGSLQNTPQANTPISQVKQQQTGTKLYKGRGFELSIPKNYVIEDHSKDFWISFNEVDAHNVVIKNVIVSTEKTTLLDPCKHPLVGYPNAQCTTINGLAALDWGSDKPPYPMGPHEYIYSFIHGGLLYTISFTSTSEDEKNKILSTFGFTN